MSHPSDPEALRQYKWGEAFLTGLCVGLTLLLLLVAYLDKQPDPHLHISTNVYAVEALAGAALGLWRVWRRAGKQWLKTPAVATLWICLGLVLWTIGQAIWTWASWIDPNPDAPCHTPYVGSSDIFYMASDAVWLLALLKVFHSLRRRGLPEISRFMPIMTTTLVLLVGAFGVIDHHQIQNLAQDAPTLVCDLLYILLTFASTVLAIALLLGQNSEIPPPAQQCLRWLCAAAAANAVGILAFTITVKCEMYTEWAYHNGNLVDWLFLVAMYCWGIAALKWPVTQEELHYAFRTMRTFGATRSEMREADVYRAGEIAENCCREEHQRKLREGKPVDEHECERVSAYVDSIGWVLSAIPRCWRVVMLGDTVVGSTFLFPVPRDIMEEFDKGDLKELEMFEKVKGRPPSWECLYLAYASILASHRRRGLAFNAFKMSIENIAKGHEKVEVYCWPTSTERSGLTEKLKEHFKGTSVTVKDLG
jgi:hypothetical protein